MTNKRLSHWCQSVLPPNYQSVRGLTDKYQQFLCEQLTEGIAATVRVINVNSTEIVIAAASSQVASYLRLHSTELRQQFHETFGGDRKIIIKSMPESLLKIDAQRPTIKPRPVSNESADNIEKNANWIEDETLRNALKSLARSLKKS